MRQFTLLQSYEILYDKNLKGCVYKRLQISDLSGLKKMKNNILFLIITYFNLILKNMYIFSHSLSYFDLSETEG